MQAATTWITGESIDAGQRRGETSLVVAVALATTALVVLVAGGLYCGSALVLAAALAAIDGCQRRSAAAAR